MNPTARIVLALLVTSALASPALSYIVVLKDGSQVVAREELVIDGDTAIITLQNGTRTSIAASEIDLERTRELNRGRLGSAQLLDDGTTTAIPSNAPPPPKRERLSDLIARREAAHQRQLGLPRKAEPGELEEPSGPVTDFRTLRERPFESTEVAEELQRTFRAQGVEELIVFQGSQDDHVRLDVTASSEASVFRALEVAASTYLHLAESYPGQVAAFELVLETGDRQPAGQFLIGEEAARLLAEEGLEPSTFFIRRVRF